jgi:precorrin-4/cobalt-precorrin-4 C11-methyltransferase
MPESQRLERVARTGATLCIFLSVQKIGRVAHTLAEHYGWEAPVAVVYRASWPDEQVLRGRLNDIEEAVEARDIDRTAIILVGPALRDEDRRSKLYDSGFSHGFREGDAE